MFRHIKCSDNPIDGVIENLKNVTNVDIFDYNYTKIEVPSNRTVEGFESGSVKVLFGIHNDGENLYWSSDDNEANKYITIYLKYSLFIEGIGIRNNQVDWYKEYSIGCSNDLISWDYQTISTENRIHPGFQNLYFPLKPQTCRVIKIKSLSSYQKQSSNYAFYRIEFFGRFIDPNAHKCTNIKSNLQSCSFLFTIFIFKR